MSDPTPIQAAEAIRAEQPLHPRPPTPLPPEPAKKRKNLALRLTTAAILVPGVIALIAAGGLVYLAAIIGVTLLGLREFYGMIESKGAHPLRGAGFAAGAALPLVAYVGNEYHATILMTVALLALMIAQLGKAEISEALASISGTFFGVFYVGWLISHAVVLREFHAVVGSKWGALAAARFNPELGVYLVLFCLTAVVLCDVGAYFLGSAYGKRKLAPAISPKKTVEGALGGVLVGAGGALALKGVFDLFWPDVSRSFGWGWALGFGVILASVGIVGDLVESVLKRDAAQKDTGALLPGMGGVLDRIDSSLFGIPLMYYLMLAYTWLQVA